MPVGARPYSVSGVFPGLDALATLLPVLEGVDRLSLVDLPRALQTGDLSPTAEQLAERIRRGTGGQVEPRNVAGYWDVAARYHLLREADDHRLSLTRHGRSFTGDAGSAARRLVAVREGLVQLLGGVAGGQRTLAELLPAWREVLAGNRRFAATTAAARSLGQRVAALVRDGWLTADGAHAERLADEAGFRRREPEPAFAGLGGGLAVSALGLAVLGGHGPDGASG